MSRSLPRLSPVLIRKLVDRALEEDMPSGQDLTSWTMIDPDTRVLAQIVARQEGILAGIALAEQCFFTLDDRLQIEALLADGASLEAGSIVMQIEGPAISLLSAERVALNFLGMMSGTASLTAQYRAKMGAHKAKLVCTRKTLPGLRALQKYAVLAGGGVNHRYSLSDGVLIKDNHIAAMGSIKNAVSNARAQLGHMTKIEVEADTHDQLVEAIRAGADAVLLDNMSPVELKEAVQMSGGQMVLEASGGIGLHNVELIAATGVDYISAGALTHSAANFDFGLDMQG